MDNLPKQLLNYFATFTETRFNFRRLINYKWTNDEFTLDLSFFTGFQNILLKKIEESDLSPISINQGDFAIKLSKVTLIAEITALLNDNFGASYIDKCISDELARLSYEEKSISIDDKGEASMGNDPIANEHIAMAKKEGIRLYNLALRRQIESKLNDLQETLIERTKNELNAEHAPASTFGITNYVNQHFEKIKLLTNSYTNSEQYLASISEYFRTSIDDIVVYDLFYNLQQYSAFAQKGSIYFFFHTMEKETEAYPLYFIEVEYRTTNTEVSLSFPRDLVLLNTPAINYFRFDNVITIPRATSISTAKQHINTIETFIQTQYGFQVPFILQPSFPSLTHKTEGFPVIKSRIGLQTVINEDKKLLDYSELMTQLELGKSSKFASFVDQYVKGIVPNHQDEVDRKFRDNFSIKQAERYISDSPIPINNSQRRILMALANEKNNIIVVDGPPGTGKSHTIAALTYWANEKKKSVVITSHKKEALDVIERMLNDKYKSLHPQSKPSVIRMDKDSGSSNNLQNTLQLAVIAAANERALDFNSEAVGNDGMKVQNDLTARIEAKLSQGEDYGEVINKTIEYLRIGDNLSKDSTIGSIINGIGAVTTELDFDKITPFLNSESISTVWSQVSLEEYEFLIQNKARIPDFIEACNKINTVPVEYQRIDSKQIVIPDGFSSLVDQLKNNFRLDIHISKLTPGHTEYSVIRRIKGQTLSHEEASQIISELSNLKYSAFIRDIARLQNKEDMTIDELVKGVDIIQYLMSFKNYQYLLESYAALPGNLSYGLAEIYGKFSLYGNNTELISTEIYNILVCLFSTYGPLLDCIGVSPQDLSSLTKIITLDGKTENVWSWIKLHSFLSTQSSNSDLAQSNLQIYYKLKQKQIENLNDERLKNFNNHLGEMAKIKVSYEGGKRFTVDESKILLDCISCIIAEPATVSKYFPMKEDLIDVLIIDEASQVSIADSISLILRAKQVVIFGDEYQYGAVSATNVSTKYSASYFSEIITAYADDYSTTVSETARKQLVDEISKEVSPDEQEIDTLLKPEDGTVLWLKTFNIRTSTLTFAKAIANYGTSLKEHFRSFPEIISYSNDFFYKEAQMELIVNRIRTKPIGEVLQFINVETKGLSGPNVNLDEIEVIVNDIKKRIDNGFKGSIGIITSFKEQQSRMEQVLNEKLNMAILKRDHKLAIWFVGDVQGEERDIVYYTFVEDKKLKNANLASIYPIIGGTADSIRSLKMQRLNVGFSRAKDTMVFVHSQPIEQFSNTRLGDALKHYQHTLEETRKNDFFIEDETVFGSEMEKKLYSLLLETKFVKENRDKVKIIPQFDIGKYIAAEQKVYMPKYRTDFLMTYSSAGKDQTLILEYDGLEYHFKNPGMVTNVNFSQEYLDYDVSRQLELESYGYRFLRINKFNLRPQVAGDTEVNTLNKLLESKFQSYE